MLTAKKLSRAHLSLIAAGCASLVAIVAVNPIDYTIVGAVIGIIIVLVGQARYGIAQIGLACGIGLSIVYVHGTLLPTCGSAATLKTL